METKEDVKQTRKDLGMSRAEFAAEMGISLGYLIQVEDGTHKVSRGITERLQAVRRRHGLIGGQWTPEEVELLQIYRSISHDNKTTLMNVARGLAKAN